MGLQVGVSSFFLRLPLRTGHFAAIYASILSERRRCCARRSSFLPAAIQSGWLTTGAAHAARPCGPLCAEVSEACSRSTTATASRGTRSQPHQGTGRTVWPAASALGLPVSWPRRECLQANVERRISYGLEVGLANFPDPDLALSIKNETTAALAWARGHCERVA